MECTDNDKFTANEEITIFEQNPVLDLLTYGI